MRAIFSGEGASPVEFPVYLRLGPLALHPHWVFEILSYLAGFRIYLWLRPHARSDRLG